MLEFGIEEFINDKHVMRVWRTAKRYSEMLVIHEYLMSTRSDIMKLYGADFPPKRWHIWGRPESVAKDRLNAFRKYTATVSLLGDLLTDTTFMDFVKNESFDGVQ